MRRRFAKRPRLRWAGAEAETGSLVPVSAVVTECVSYQVSTVLNGVQIQKHSWGCAHLSRPMYA